MVRSASASCSGSRPLTVDHGDHAVPSLLAGRPVRDHLHRDDVAFVRLQLRDNVGAGVPSGASGVDQCPRVLVETLNGVGVIVGHRRRPGAGDGGGALRATVEAMDLLGFYSRRQRHVNIINTEQWKS